MFTQHDLYMFKLHNFNLLKEHYLYMSKLHNLCLLNEYDPYMIKLHNLLYKQDFYVIHSYMQWFQ